jgi:hypothetical protein
MIIRKLSIYLFLILCCGITNAQGLEKVIVEKYYISDVKDSSHLGGNLPAGSVTYRIFLDMLPRYRFQAAFGIPGHELRLATTTTFFNNEDYGGTVPNVIPDRKLGDYNVMLDSWLSVGGASEGTLGILKTLDDTVETVNNLKGFLQSTNPVAGIPVKIRDGLVNGTPAKVTGFGIDSIINVFNKQSTGSLFSTTNGSWAAMGGTIGPDSTDNKVLIAQITTNGIFSFELNIQIGTPSGGVEQYVAKNPKGSEIVLDSLIYTSASNMTSKGGSAKPSGKK